ncbi:DNA cytosine methyltransferase [Desulfofundulus salinus]|uniref:Cytosine-specific methyltransferase n=2 Tax=Desulfofundulus salinus TaxID=2419843 RepID=A0A494X4L9_9FIRM|nr:DNA cytosine methyltransferase [Desulfofundulus salinum]
MRSKNEDVVGYGGVTLKILAGGKPPLTFEEEFTAVDLYCGCGGVTEGLKQSGFRVVAAVDNDPVACKTYRKNHPEVNLYESDIENVDPMIIRREDLKGCDVDLLVVCAPCQPFSSLNRNKGRDGRADLILQTVRFARVLRPAVIFLENVPGLTRYDEIISKLKEELRELGYRVGGPHKINAADYMVPQRRTRCILMVTRLIDPPQPPPPLTPEGSRITVRATIGKLRPLKSGEKDPCDPLHAARKHNELTIKRLSHIPKDGGSRSSLPSELQLKCHKGHDGHPDVYGRMAWDSLAPTLTTGCTDVTKGRFAHPEQDRAITLREAALLQTFPKTYEFAGGPTAIARQIGNAVPVEMVKALAPTFKKSIREIREREKSEVYREAVGGYQSQRGQSPDPGLRG